nr:PREDICTED: thaumatin-like protein 1b [Musa acuminata subsp. malaccensis]
MAQPPLVSLAAFFVAVLISGAHSTTFNFKNNCPYPVWPASLANAGKAALSQTGFQLDSGASLSVDAPPAWGGRMWTRHRCSADSSGRFSCLSGDCGTGQVACNGAGGAPPTTLVEFTLQGDGGKDFYDVSCVDGFNVPVSVVPSGGSNCDSTSCQTNINARCPTELQMLAPDGSVVGCKSACLAFDTDEYCCRGQYGGPDTCKPTSYSKMFKDACPQAYSYAYDDKSSTFTCVGANYDITYCP